MKSVIPGLSREDCGSSCWRLPNADSPNASWVLVRLRHRTASSVRGVSVKSHRRRDDLNFLNASICVEGDLACTEDLPIHTWPKASCVGLVISHTPTAARNSLCGGRDSRCGGYRNECSKNACSRRECLHDGGASTPTVTAFARSVLLQIEEKG
jgi:hypothetical protein